MGDLTPVESGLCAQARPFLHEFVDNGVFDYLHLFFSGIPLSFATCDELVDAVLQVVCIFLAGLHQDGEHEHPELRD